MNYPSWFVCKLCDYFNWHTGGYMVCQKCKKNNKPHTPEAK